jgi:hypothetical protein
VVAPTIESHAQEPAKEHEAGDVRVDGMAGANEEDEAATIPTALASTGDASVDIDVTVDDASPTPEPRHEPALEAPQTTDEPEAPSARKGSHRRIETVVLSREDTQLGKGPVLPFTPVVVPSPSPVASMASGDEDDLAEWQEKVSRSTVAWRWLAAFTALGTAVIVVLYFSFAGDPPSSEGSAGAAVTPTAVGAPAEPERVHPRSTAAPMARLDAPPIATTPTPVTGVAGVESKSVKPPKPGKPQSPRRSVDPSTTKVAAPAEEKKPPAEPKEPVVIE